MDEYVVVQNPNNHIVLGINDDRPESVHVVQFDERYESCYPNHNQMVLIGLIVIFFMMAGSIYV